jgi:hypothetical protein
LAGLHIDRPSVSEFGSHIVPHLLKGNSPADSLSNKWKYRHLFVRIIDAEATL